VDTTYFTRGSDLAIILVYPAPPPTGLPVGFGSAPKVAPDSEMGISLGNMNSPVMRTRKRTSPIMRIRESKFRVVL